MKIYSFLCIFESVLTNSDENTRIWNIIDEANDRKKSIEKNSLQSMQNSFAIENLQATVTKQNILIYEQSKSLLELKSIVNEQNQMLENQKTFIETLYYDLDQTHLQLNVTAAELNDQNKILENQGILIETLSNDLDQTQSHLDATEVELQELRKDFDANDFDPCVRTCSQSLEGKTQWKDHSGVSFIS